MKVIAAENTSGYMETGVNAETGWPIDSKIKLLAIRFNLESMIIMKFKLVERLNADCNKALSRN